MLYFTADYKDRDLLLSLGAVWDKERWRWRVDNSCDYKKFEKWINGRIITDRLYIVEAEDCCPFCGENVRLYAIACGEYREDFLSVRFGENSLNFLYGFENISGSLAKILKERFFIRQRFVQTYGYKYLINGCNHCGKAFPDEYLFADDSSPFYIDSTERAKKLKIFYVPIDFDVALAGKIAFSFEKPLFKDCKKEVLTDFNFFDLK